MDDPFENKCDRCGKKQIPCKKTGDFRVFKAKEICECGGTYCTYCNGTQVEFADSKRLDIGG